MYEEIIAFLRYTGAVYEGNTIDEDDKKVLLDAGDAIERLTKKIEHLQRAYNAVHDEYNMECFAFKFGYLDSAIRDALGIKGGSNEQQS